MIPHAVEIEDHHDQEPLHVAGGVAEMRPLRTKVQREQVFQRVAVAFIKQVLTPPMFVTSICHENELTQNARARARARGMLPGIPDLYIAQHWKLALWLELKWGNNALSDEQRAVGRVLADCGIRAGAAWSIHEVLRELRAAGFALHGNADGLAQVYQARAEAAVARAEINKGRTPSRSSKPRTRGRKGTPAQHARVNAARFSL